MALLLSAGAGLLAARPASAQDSTAVAAPWYERITFDGMASTSYSYNFDRPVFGQNRLRVFDVDDRTFTLDVAELVVQRAPAPGDRAGFRVDVALGSSIPRVTAATGLFRRGPSVAGDDVDLQQAYASYLVGGGSGFHVDAGKFVTPAGAEVIEGYDGWNDNATRSFLFGYAIPFTHVGVRAGATLGSRASFMVMVVNGWDLARDNNTRPSVGAQLGLAPSSALSLTITDIVGPEQPSDDDHWRELADLVATMRFGSRWSATLNADYGREPLNVGTTPAHWAGGAGYLRWQAGRRWALIGRGEVFDDPQGSRTGTRQRLAEVTLTPELRPSPHFVLRADVRRDHSDRQAFEKRGRPVQEQTTVLVNAIATF